MIGGGEPGGGSQGDSKEGREKCKSQRKKSVNSEVCWGKKNRKGREGGKKKAEMLNKEKDKDEARIMLEK